MFRMVRLPRVRYLAAGRVRCGASRPAVRNRYPRAAAGRGYATGSGAKEKRGGAASPTPAERSREGVGRPRGSVPRGSGGCGRRGVRGVGCGWSLR